MTIASPSRSRRATWLAAFLTLVGATRRARAQPLPTDVPARVAQSVVEIRAGDLATTGALVGRWNTVITTASALAGAPRGPVGVRFRDGCERRGSVVAVRPDLDLAVVEIAPAGSLHPPLPLGGGADALRVDAMLHAGTVHQLPTVTVATVRGLADGDRAFPVLDLATNGVALEPGAPLVSADGRLQGLVLRAGTHDDARGLGVESVRAVLEGRAPAWPRPAFERPSHLQTEHVALVVLGALGLVLGLLALRRRRANHGTFHVVATPAHPAPVAALGLGTPPGGADDHVTTFTIVGPQKA